MYGAAGAHLGVVQVNTRMVEIGYSYDHAVSLFECVFGRIIKVSVRFCLDVCHITALFVTCVLAVGGKSL